MNKKMKKNIRKMNKRYYTTICIDDIVIFAISLFILVPCTLVCMLEIASIFVK